MYMPVSHFSSLLSFFHFSRVKQVIRRSGGSEVSFEVDAFRKHCLVNGLDDIGLTLEKASEISQYEAKRNLEAPWTFNLATA
mmetsp:Transcript_26714/g.45586  ORF Transcript_26714/g.45586 Transcript_26714/m.45586 type:complete len:82 (+) Transcript_26714:303-548(+)